MAIAAIDVVHTTHCHASNYLYLAGNFWRAIKFMKYPLNDFVKLKLGISNATLDAQ